MIRKVIKIDEELCNGCGACANACHESAIGMVDGKAKLLRDDYCDGLGNCLPACPTGAITFEEREAAEFNETEVKKHLQDKPGNSISNLKQWPVQIKLANPGAAYFNGANLLIAADCTAYAHASFNQTFMRNKVTLIGCPKLDEGNYTEKLTAILSNNSIKSVTIIRMEVPCCGGIVAAATEALRACGKMIPWNVITLATDGHVIEE